MNTRSYLPYSARRVGTQARPNNELLAYALVSGMTLLLAAVVTGMAITQIA